MKSKILIFVLSLSALMLVMAAKSAGKPQMSAKQAYAERLAKVMMPESYHEYMAGAIVQNSIEIASGDIEFKGGKVDIEASEAEVNDLIRKKFSYEYFTKLSSESLEKKFTEKELKAISKFFETSAGKKWLDESPKVMDETRNVVQADIQGIVPSVATLITAKALPPKDNSKS